METKLSVEELEFYRERGEYFDTHDMGDEMENMPEIECDFSDARFCYYFEVERELRDQLRTVGRVRGTSAETLLNDWLRERLAEEARVDTKAV